MPSELAVYVTEVSVLPKATPLRTGKFLCRHCCENPSLKVLAYLIDNAELHQKFIGSMVMICTQYKFHEELSQLNLTNLQNSLMCISRKSVVQGSLQIQVHPCHTFMS